MKRVSYLMVAILAFVVGIVSYNAATLECTPQTVGVSDDVTCTVYANVEKGLSNIVMTGDGITSQPATSVTANSKANLGKITFKANSERSTQTVNVTITGDYEDSTAFNDSASKQISVKSKSNDITNIKVDGVAVVNEKVTVDKETIKVTASTSEFATLSGVGDVKLKCGANTVEIKSKAEALNEAKKSITVTRTCDTNKLLKNIKVSAKDKDGNDVEIYLSPSFDEDTKEYKIDVDKDVEKITIKGVKNNEKQKLTGEVTDKVLAFGENKFKLVITSEQGGATEYEIVVTRKDERSEVATLKNIKLDNGKLKFDSEKTDYYTKVLYSVTEVKVEVEKEDSNAKVEITGNKNLKVGKNTITIKVTSENEKVTKEYKIIVERYPEGKPLGDNAFIKSLKIKGYKIEFDKEKLEYTIRIKDDKSLKFTIVMDEEGATYKILNNSALSNNSTVRIVTKSLDGEETLTYKINIKKDMGLLTYIIIGGSAFVALLLIIIVIVKKRKNSSSDFDLKQRDLVDRPADNINYVNQYAPIDSIDQTIEYNEPRISPVPANEDITGASDVEAPRSTREELRRIQLDDSEKDIDIYSSILTGKTVKKIQEESNVNSFDEARSTQSEEAATKVCSICGHRIAASLTTCPYCKRTF